MKKSIGGLVVCLLGLTACNVEHYDDCDGVDLEGDFGGSHSLPSKPASGGKGSPRDPFWPTSGPPVLCAGLVPAAVDPSATRLHPQSVPGT